MNREAFDARSNLDSYQKPRLVSSQAPDFFATVSSFLGFTIWDG